jgi:hypothetical protein
VLQVINVSAALFATRPHGIHSSDVPLPHLKKPDRHSVIRLFMLALHVYAASSAALGTTEQLVQISRIAVLSRKYPARHSLTLLSLLELQW